MEQKRPRDSQRSKLYKAENVAFPNKENEIGSIAETQQWVNDLLAQRWFRSRWGNRQIEVRFKAYGSATASTWRNSIQLPPWSRNPAVVLHEVAHLLTPRTYAAHGREFAATFLTLVKYQIGKDAYDRLRAAFVAGRVKHRGGYAVPKPGTHHVPTKQAVAVKRRLVLAAKTESLVQPDRMKSAAAVIRAAARTGAFGPAGSTARTRALATARQLEKGVA